MGREQGFPGLVCCLRRVLKHCVLPSALFYYYYYYLWGLGSNSGPCIIWVKEPLLIFIPSSYALSYLFYQLLLLLLLFEMGSYHVAQTGLTLMSILLPQPPQYQNCKHKPLYLACALFQKAGTRGHFRKRLFKSWNILSIKALPSAILPHEVTHPFPGGFCTARALLSQLQTH